MAPDTHATDGMTDTEIKAVAWDAHRALHEEYDHRHFDIDDMIDDWAEDDTILSRAKAAVEVADYFEVDY